MDHFEIQNEASVVANYGNNNSIDVKKGIFFFQRAQTSNRYWLLLFVNYVAMFGGSITSSLLAKLYFNHIPDKGSKSTWIATAVQSVGFPTLFLLLLGRRRSGRGWPFSTFTRRLLLRSASVGLLMGLNNFLISWGLFYLPVSTSSLLLSTQLACNLVLSVLMVRQKVRMPIINTVLLITVASVAIALGARTDLPAGVSQGQYFLGFISILGAALLFAIYLPLMEIVLRDVTAGYRQLVEVQILMQLAATVFAVFGMTLDKGWRATFLLGAMRAESLTFTFGPAKYWATIVATVLTWQLVFMGTAGVVYLTTSLTTGICMTALLPMNVLAGVVTFHDAFSPLKGIATVLCVWAFSSYLYGEYHIAIAAQNRAAAAIDNDGADRNRAANFIVATLDVS